MVPTTGTGVLTLFLASPKCCSFGACAFVLGVNFGKVPPMVNSLPLLSSGVCEACCAVGLIDPAGFADN